MTVLLGIDPGSHNTGFGIIDRSDTIKCIDFGVLTANPNWSFEKRLAFMGDELERIIAYYKPQLVVIEDVFTAKNIKSSLQLAHIRGLCVYQAMKYKAEIISYATKSVKKGITGNGNAMKDQVAMALEVLLGMPIHVNKLDATDALALAYYHANKMDILQKFGAQI